MTDLAKSEPPETFEPEEVEETLAEVEVSQGESMQQRDVYQLMTDATDSAGFVLESSALEKLTF